MDTDYFSQGAKFLKIDVAQFSSQKRLQSVYKRFRVLKRIVSEIKDENDFVTFCFYLMKNLPTSDQLNIIMVVKHKPSN